MLCIILNTGEVIRLTSAKIKTEYLNTETLGVKIIGYNDGENFFAFYTMNQISAIVPIERR